MRCPTAEDRRHAFERDRYYQVTALLKPLDWHALWADEEEEEWLLYPLIPARRLIALFSAAKAGKSLLMLEIAAALSTGRKVLGHDPGRRIRVLYIDFENDPRGDVRTRLQDMGYEPGELDHLDYLSFPSLPYLDSEAGAASLIAAVEAYRPELVVIDTISRAVGGEENDNNTWLNLYKHTGLALKQAKVAMIRLDHTGKDETKGQRGGSAKSGDVDAIWKLTTEIKDERYLLTCLDARFSLDAKELTLLRHDYPLHHTLQDLSPINDREVKIQDLIEHADRDGLPVDTGARKFREWMTARGLKAKKDTLEEAVRRRKNRSGLLFEPVRHAQNNVPPAKSGGGTPEMSPQRPPAINGNGQNPLSEVPPASGGHRGDGLPPVSPLSTPPYKGGTGGQGTLACPDCGWLDMHKATCSQNPAALVVEEDD